MNEKAFENHLLKYLLFFFYIIHTCIQYTDHLYTFLFLPMLSIWFIYHVILIIIIWSAKKRQPNKLINNFQCFEHHQLANQIHNRVKTIFDEHKNNGNRNDISKARLACTLFVFVFIFLAFGKLAINTWNNKWIIQFFRLNLLWTMFLSMKILKFI